MLPSEPYAFPCRNPSRRRVRCMYILDKHAAILCRIDLCCLCWRHHGGLHVCRPKIRKVSQQEPVRRADDGWWAEEKQASAASFPNVLRGWIGNWVRLWLGGAPGGGLTDTPPYLTHVWRIIHPLCHHYLYRIVKLLVSWWGHLLQRRWIHCRFLYVTA